MSESANSLFFFSEKKSLKKFTDLNNHKESYPVSGVVASGGNPVSGAAASGVAPVSDVAASASAVVAPRVAPVSGVIASAVTRVTPLFLTWLLLFLARLLLV